MGIINKVYYVCKFVSKIFSAGEDPYTAAIQFQRPIVTRFLRIIPTEWHDWISMKVEVLGHTCPCSNCIASK